MAGSDVLLAVAEIAIAFAGFSSIVAVLGQRTSGRWGRADVFRLAAMVQSSLITLLFAFLPLCLSFLGLGEPAAWVVASILLAGAIALLTSLSHLRARSLYSPAESSSAGTSRGIAAAMLLLGGLIVALQVCNIFGVVFKRGPGPYITGLVLLLGISAVQFVRLLFPGLTIAE